MLQPFTGGEARNSADERGEAGFTAPAPSHDLMLPETQDSSVLILLKNVKGHDEQPSYVHGVPGDVPPAGLQELSPWCSQDLVCVHVPGLMETLGFTLESTFHSSSRVQKDLILCWHCPECQHALPKQ